MGGAAQRNPSEAARAGHIDADIDSRQVILCNCSLIPEHVRIGHQDQLVVTEWDFAGSLTAKLELCSALGHWTPRPSNNRVAAHAFRGGYTDTASAWPTLELASFAIAVTAYVNWTHNTICEAIDPADSDRAAFAERETIDLLNRPMTRSSLEQVLAAVDT